MPKLAVLGFYLVMGGPLPQINTAFIHRSVSIGTVDTFTTLTIETYHLLYRCRPYDQYAATNRF